MKRITSLLFLFLVFTAPLLSQDTVPVNQLEKISAFRIEMDTMVFTVWNSGYTDKASFILEIKKAGAFYDIKLIRIKSDFGKMMPQPMEIAFTQEELKGKIDLRTEVRVLNSFSIYAF